VVSGERDRLKQLVLILVDNALSYTPEGGEVRLALTTEGSEASLRVEDDGIGISTEVTAHAFERFYRGAEAQRLDPSGTGLGLSIARWIVERHGGTIVLGPGVPRGTRATVHLPMAVTRSTTATSGSPAGARREPSPGGRAEIVTRTPLPPA